MSSFTENLYLKRHLKQLQEENLKLKRTINEVYGPGAYPNPVGSVDLKPSDLKPMKELDVGPTSEELIRRHGKAGTVNLGSLPPELQNRIGAAHVELGQEDEIPANHLNNFPHYAAGVARGRKFFGL